MTAKTRVALFGASGTMGFQTFKELWKRREKIDITILVLPSEQKLGLFREYEREVGLPILQGAGVTEKNGFKIVWGDATRYDDVAETVRGVDWVLNCMAYISPMADYHPQIAEAVNSGAIASILKAIESEPDGAERIRYIHTGSVAETGNRPVGIHFGRIGDPLKPSIFDFYALTKISGERLVLESNIKHWVSLRMTFIMPTSWKEMASLMDAISFHMPLDARMENITDRDAGFGMANTLDIPDDSDFWRRVYNMGGGPGMRITAYDYLSKNYESNGLRSDQCAARNWYALRNFHMHYYEDSQITNQYLHYWRDSMGSYLSLLANDMPLSLKFVAFLARRIPAFRQAAEKSAYATQQVMAEKHKNAPPYWYKAGNAPRISAFFKDQSIYEAIPAWGVDMPNLDPDAAWKRLEHGYDESKPVLALSDLQAAASFRGGECKSDTWDGDLYTVLQWRCASGHEFSARPFTVLKAGHWCPDCVCAWNFDEQARKNPFFAQVWYADHDQDENNNYSPSLILDIQNADRDWDAYLKNKKA